MLNAAQIEVYDRNGYLAIEGVLTAPELEELRQVTDEFVERSGTSRRTTGPSTLSLGTVQHRPVCAASGMSRSR